ncbi:heme ABC transporter ATP-binding protein [Stappia sp. F7233]|uniref:Heme ABC transporter ATP-binding protein n=1 Tax=Stappia albiluteola TaxID=2758565 RepID=A0A839AAM4_9HYPH|nr:heme ABC transporter ATP-binding protein [Stappia albiluteola]MBA5776175.1 heme ABC transporter ATP-binding protein [Stappia albiluteola]
MLVARNLHYSAGGRQLLADISLEIRPGELTVIVGPNGAGKSTLFSCLTGERKPRSGTVTLNGRDLRRFSAPELAALRAVMAQSALLSFPFTVQEVVELGLARAGTNSARSRLIAEEALHRVDLAGYGSRSYQTLSGGERQRVQLARVLCQVWRPVAGGGPRYLFLDEPTSSLDIRHQFDVLEIAADFAKRGGAAIAILHDLAIARTYADKLIVLENGRLHSSGEPAITLKADMLKQVFRLSDAHLARMAASISAPDHSSAVATARL